MERFAVLGSVQRKLSVPDLAGRRFNTVEVPIQSAKLAELIATKVRALHQRRKGRDLFDLYMAMGLIDDPVVLRKLVLYYFAASGHPFERGAFFRTLDEKLSDRRFRDDLGPYLKPGGFFDWEADAARVRAWLDEDDRDFQLAARALCGQAGKAPASALERIRQPLLQLFGDAYADHLSEPARSLSADELRHIISRLPPA